MLICIQPHVAIESENESVLNQEAVKKFLNLLLFFPMLC